jgi:DNA-binding CsgD family transcriptional regulator
MTAESNTSEAHHYCQILNDAGCLGLIMFRYDLLKKCFVWVSNNVEDVLGYAPDTVSLWSMRELKELIHPSDESVFTRFLGHLLRKETAPFRAVIRLRAHNGRYLCFAGSSASLKECCVGRRHELTGVLLCLDEMYFSDKSMALSKGGRKKDPSPSALDKLTRRELEVLSYFSRGYHCREIAEKLNLSFHTVDTHRKALLRKLNMPSIAAMAAFAGECGLNH